MIRIGRYSLAAGRSLRASSGSARIAGSLALLGLVSCSGDDGGGAATNLQANPKAGFLNSISEPPSPAAAGDWSGSQEYVNSTGLAQLKAAEGYAQRSGGLPGGEGVRIAIIDSGIDVTHPDLGNLAKTSWSAGNEAIIGDSHATFVAGIAAASRTQSSDPNDMHGIAYRATLVNFQAARPSQTAANGFVSFGMDDLVDAISAASGLSTGEEAVESDILNLSLGAPSSSDSTFSRLRTAMRDAADEDKIIVLAAGNEGLSSDPADKLQPIYPAAYADDAGMAGLAIVVGNLTSADEAAASSNLCGDTKNFCLFAPGTSIQSTTSGGVYGIGSGTSFAAPYVAGAAAVVKAAFPGVSSRDVVDRLLLTAEDLGDAGVDSTFGRGRLDLEAAMAPVGPTAIPTGSTVDGPSAAVETSSLRLGPGMIMDSAASALLKRVMTVDRMGFPFPVDLTEVVSTAKRDDGLSSFVNGDRRSVAAAGTGVTQIAAFLPEDVSTDFSKTRSSTSLRQHSRANETVPFHFSADVTERTTIFAALNDRHSAQSGLEAELANRRSTLMQTSSFFSSYDGLANASNGAGVSFRPTDGAEITVSAFASLDPEREQESAVQRVDVMQAMPGGIDLRLGLGLVQEDDGFVGGRARGAFGEDMSARSQFMTISLLGALFEDVDWFATYSRGRSSIDEAEGSLFGNWSNTGSEAFGAGLIIRDVAKDNDGLSFMVGQPIRQEHAKATVSLPVGRKPDGTVVTEKKRLNFAPEAREITAEIGYRLSLGQGRDQQIEAVGFFRTNPDHDPDSDPEAGFGLAYRWQF